MTAQRPTMEPPTAAAPKTAEKDQYPAFKRKVTLVSKNRNQGRGYGKGSKSTL